jgi:hypothetical protein
MLLLSSSADRELRCTKGRHEASEDLTDCELQGHLSKDFLSNQPRLQGQKPAAARFECAHPNLDLQQDLRGN